MPLRALRFFVTRHPEYAPNFGAGQKTTSAMARWHWLVRRPCIYLYANLISYKKKEILLADAVIFEIAPKAITVVWKVEQEMCSRARSV